MTYDEHGLFVDAPHLEGFAENYARSLRPDSYGDGREEARALRRTLRELRALHETLAQTWEGVPAMPDGARWLLDNDYLVRREGAQAAAELEQGRELRFAGTESLLLRLCDSLLRSGQWEVTEERIAAYLRGFQRALVLEGAELGLLCAGLRAELIRALPGLYRRAAEGQDPGLAKEAEKIITALRHLSTADLRELTEEADLAEQLLRRDPAGVYPAMAEESRADYRRTLARLARANGLPEHQAAQRVLSLAKGGSGAAAHVGWWLYRAPLGRAQAAKRGGWYLALNLLSPLFLSLLLAFATGSALFAPLLLLPISELVKSLVDFILLHLVRPVHLPRLALEDGVPAEGRSLCVVSVLLTGAEEAAGLCRHLEECRLLSRDAGRELRFALLADLPEAAAPERPEDEASLKAAIQGVEALNRRYGGGFYLLVRPRTESREGRWRGWERKRGALLETMRLLRGKTSGVRVAAGEASALENTRFLLALDSDTRLSPGAARSMIGAMLHPLNAPLVDETRRVVRSGHGILAPRIGLRLADAVRTDFSRVFAGQGGADPYDGTCSDLFMDLWDCGGFAGKGIIDIDAYLQCLDERIPEETLLSHDAVEGAYLRAGFQGDVEVCDGFPGSALAYYARLDRWTRGDWQNLPWLLGRGRDLSELRRWRLFDSLRRSLVPPATFLALALGFLLPGAGWTLAAAAALLALLTELLLLAADTALHRATAPQRPFSAALFLGMGGALARTLLRLLLLPAEAWYCLRAACRALWRLLVSHRRLLEWQTAAQGERRRAGLAGHYLALWPAPAAGLALLLFSPGALGKAAGLLWLLTPLCALLLSLPRPDTPTLAEGDRALLLDYARDTWRFFAEFLTPEDHFLPPDNFQQKPPAGLAHRTSPTNLGLGLLSILAAIDLGLTDRETGLSLLRQSLDTAEALPRWRGHFYNWYQTQTLDPLSPLYVSTVDSGNLCACLIALSSGLREKGEPLLAARAERLSRGMDFAPLYDRRRRLFYIGLDPVKGLPSEAHYDLLSSEARLTAYLAVARGDVPRDCWRRLSRAQLAWGRHRGMASWTGTMFEYLMPELLLPLLRHSLLDESARFCLYVQRRRARGLRTPWGCSESAYAALDVSMTYRYKAHGCAGLALRRGMDEEFVVAPYSSFLALPLAPTAALRNLRRLERLGLRGPWGFWEALDLTPARCPEGSAVKCVMAHHQGMSLVAAANALTDGAMQRRFLADPAMGAYQLLLEEKVPYAVTTIRRGGREARPLGRRQSPERWSREGAGTDFLRPACCLLSGQDYHLLVAETGLCRPRWGSIAPYVPGRSPLDREHGIDLCLLLEGEEIPLLPDPAGDGMSDHRWRFSTDRAELALVHPRLRGSLTVSLSRGETGERRILRLRGLEKTPAVGTLVFRFRPILAPERDYRAHPAFCALGLSARLERGCLLLRRLPRQGGPERWMCLAATAPLTVDLAPGAASGRAAGPVLLGNEERFLNDSLITVQCDVEIQPGRETELCLALAMGMTEAEALEGARRILEETEAADLPRSAAAVLGMDDAAVDRAMSLLPALCFPGAPGKPVGRDALWRFGVSGDLPVAALPFRAEEELDWARQWMDCHLFLCGCGLAFDLVFLVGDGGGYQTPLKDLLERTLRRGGEEPLLQRLGGVYLLEAGAGTEDLLAAATVTAEPGRFPERPRQTLWRAARLPGPCGPQKVPETQWSEKGTVSFLARQSLPPRAWQNVLTNGRFGYLATDCGAGNLWHQNARENPITPWRCQPWATSGPERLLLEGPDGLHSLFADDPEETLVRYCPGAAVWEARRGPLRLRMTAFVPTDTDARVLLLDCEGPAEGWRLHWSAALQLCPEPEDARFCRVAAGEGLLAAENPRAMAGARPFLWAVIGGVGDHSFDRAEAEALRYTGAAPGGEPVFAARLPLRQTQVLVCGCDAPDRLRALTEPEAAQRALGETLNHWNGLLSRLALRSGVPALDRLCNGWLAYQVLACRLLGRCSVYQSGGAYGFRDQLQDAVNLLLLDAAPARAQILRCCARQYAEGDVQHWWHPGVEPPRGVRTRCSDDLLWLPWAVAEYVEQTGDASLLTQGVPFLFSPPLSPAERDRYDAAVPGTEAATVLEHCRRALALVMERGTGPHGLLPIGSGDWNDGFDLVEGESEWLSWFFLLVADRFDALLDRPLPGLEDFCDHLAEAANAAWDGAWYLRGWYADGRPLGSKESPECRIDALAQSFAVLSGRADPAKAAQALDSACMLLHDRENGLVRLFTPPFAGREHPGYLESYGPGFRENGGQYTHGALWLALALVRAGQPDRAWALLEDLLPADKDPLRYGAEPYVLSADVSAAPGHVGEAGWSWYTGAAGWLLRLVYGELLGLRLRGEALRLAPRLPAALEGCAVIWRGHRVEYSGGAVRVDGVNWDGCDIK